MGLFKLRSLPAGLDLVYRLVEAAEFSLSDTRVCGLDIWRAWLICL